MTLKTEAPEAGKAFCFMMMQVGEVLSAYVEELERLTGNAEIRDYRDIDLNELVTLKVPELVCRNLFGAYTEVTRLYRETDDDFNDECNKEEKHDDIKR